MRDFARLREHLRLALLCAPLAVSCSGQQPTTGGGGGGGLVRNVPDGGSVYKAPVAEVPLPQPEGGCGERGQWCGPIEQATKLASGSESGSESGTISSCPERFDVRDRGIYFSFDAEATKLKQDAGEALCCYHWSDGCAKGRPLYDTHGRPMVATLQRGRAWGGVRRPAPSGPAGVGAALASRLARGWLEDALAEHASIASFARAQAELLAVGAPLALVAGCQRAGLDEIRHARRCFALAARYGLPYEPTALPSAAPRATSLARLAADTFAEGCVGETVAALRAQRALAGCRDPIVAATLRGIVRDETRHAALAWKTVAWAVCAGGRDVTDALAAAMESLRPGDTAEIPVAVAVDPAFAAHGRLDDAAMHAARLDAWNEIILPLTHRTEELHA